MSISNSRLSASPSRMPRMTAAIPPREPVSLGPITNIFMGYLRAYSELRKPSKDAKNASVLEQNGAGRWPRTHRRASASPSVSGQA